VFEVVVDGYDAVYPAVAASQTFRRLWAQHAYGGDFPEEYAHISFLTFDELRGMAEHLGLGEHGVLVDLACGAGGPGLWVASQAGASLIGIDPSAAGLTEARGRAQRVGFADRACYRQGTFAITGLDAAAADGVLSVDAVQYESDKVAVFAEARRILPPGGRLTFSALEVEPARRGSPGPGGRSGPRLRAVAPGRRLCHRLVPRIRRLGRARSGDLPRGGRCHAELDRRDG
jgi:SAM-dependent methyltransferase